MLGCPSGDPGRDRETKIALQRCLQIELHLVHETLQHQGQQERLQGAAEELQKRLQGLSYAAE
jgi:hypothetical protein